MANYEKPVVISNEDAFEGVYAASGEIIGGGESADCWDVGGSSVQAWNGAWNVFEMWANHHTDVVHITTEVTFNYTFSAPITEAQPEGGGYDVSVNGNVVTVVRNFHANGYNSGDRVTFKLFVKAGDQAATEQLNLTGITYRCRHETNVQGGID